MAASILTFPSQRLPESPTRPDPSPSAEEAALNRAPSSSIGRGLHLVGSRPTPTHRTTRPIHAAAQFRSVLNRIDWEVACAATRERLNRLFTLSAPA
jgi:hypothetical protein